MTGIAKERLEQLKAMTINPAFNDLIAIQESLGYTDEDIADILPYV